MSTTQFTAEERQAVKKQWNAPHLLVIPLGLIGVSAIYRDWPSGHWGWTAAWTVFTAYMFLCWGSCLHECAHQTLSGSRRLSVFLGRLLGFFMWIPYTVYRETHIRHHAYLNTPSDWELWPYSDPKRTRRFRRAFAIFDLLIGAYTIAFVYGRIFWHRDSPIRSRQLRQTIALEYLGSAVLWGGLPFYFQYRYGDWASAMIAPIFVPLLLSGFFQTLRKFTEHLGMKSYDPLQGTRTVIGGNPVTRLLSHLNFNIFVHGPHHRHPRLTHGELEQKMNDYRVEHPDSTYPVYATYFAAFREMLPFLLKNPGVGMNAGAEAPAGISEANGVEDFAADVTNRAA